jgi:pimeloyl-ACP methyl ester carboxylesterase
MSPFVKRLARLGIVAAVALSATVAVSAASAAGPPSAVPVRVASTAPKPTVVFVHGAFADASGFATEIAALQALGYPVLTAPDPLRSLAGDADYVRSFLQTISGPIVLVGHSYGGAVITNAAVGVPNVKALVYLGAFVLDQGENIATTPDPQTYPGALLGPATIDARPTPNPYAPGGADADLTIKPANFRAVFAADVPNALASVMAATQRPLSFTAFTGASGVPAWKTIPSWDLITLDDKAIAPAGQRFMAERAHAHIQTVHSSHAVMVSHPEAVIRIVLAAANTVG